MQVSHDEAGFDEVLAGAKAGDERAWSELYRTFAGPLRGYLFAKGGREPDDLLGEVFVDVARRLHAFEGTAAQFRSWMFMVAHNRVIDERRRFARRPVDPVEDADLDGASHGHDVEAEVMSRLMVDDALGLIDSLTGDQRAVLRLRLVDGLTIDEVAEALDKPAGAVKALQRRGLAAAIRARDHKTGARDDRMDTVARTPAASRVGNSLRTTEQDHR